ncbi:MAG TPA: cobalamin-dependent protein [Aestuariivirgaceae bacterium]|nr:cobalamin-dependent protein [Aestuariivirgaceae bacterium]
MTVALSRTLVFPEKTLPDAAGLIAEGRAMAREVTVGRAPFLQTYGVGSEIEYKRKAMEQGRITMHAQIGFRDLAKSRRAYHEIWDRLAGSGCRVDRYGICLDWSMGYPRAMRKDMPRGTGLIMHDIDDWISLTSAAPVAPHFGDFVIGTPAAFENTIAALLSGSTSIGNLGQYFAFRQPHWDDDIFTTAESLKAIALTAAQPVPVIVHSNLDDGFASIFTDLSCSLGTILLEQYIVDELLGGHAAYSFGNTYAKPFSRLAFQRAAQRISTTPGTMIYGATTMYGPNHAANYAALATYLRVDIYGEKTRPAGHAVNPTPVTEADRIPDIDEIVDVHMFANRLVELDLPLHGLYRDDEVDAVADQIVLGGRQFKSNVLNGFTQAGIDIGNPFEMLLAIRRIGSKRLEELYGPGQPDPGRLRGRMPLVRSHSIEQLEQEGEGLLGRMTLSDRNAIAAAGLRGCIATTDVHEYGKVLIETVLKGLGVEIIDGGISTDPNDLALQAQTSAADFIALSSYNGVALQFVTELRRELGERGTDLPVFIGGKLNRIPDGTNTSLPVDISKEIAAAGAIVCTAVDGMITQLLQVARNRPAAGNRHRAR